MSLRFDVCSLCDERHVVAASGAMSIHQTAVGERCPGAIAGMFPHRPWPEKTVDRAASLLAVALVRAGLKPVPTKPTSGRKTAPETISESSKRGASTEDLRLLRKVEHEVLKEIAAAEKRKKLSDEDPEMAAAFEAARYPRNRVSPKEPKKKGSPIVYITKTNQVVSGGLPTLGRRSR